MINITINNKQHGVEEGTTLDMIIASTTKDVPGYAVAVNQTIVPKQELEKTKLCEGDSITLFQVIAGG